MNSPLKLGDANFKEYVFDTDQDIIIIKDAQSSDGPILTSVFNLATKIHSFQCHHLRIIHGKLYKYREHLNGIWTMFSPIEFEILTNVNECDEKFQFMYLGKNEIRQLRNKVTIVYERIRQLVEHFQANESVEENCNFLGLIDGKRSQGLVYNCQSNQFVTADPSDYCISHLNWIYNEDEAIEFYDEFNSFLNWIFGNDVKSRSIFLAYMWSLLFGKKFNLFLILTNSENRHRTGKRTLLRLISAFFDNLNVNGAKYLTAPSSRNNFNAHDAGLNYLLNKRALTAYVTGASNDLLNTSFMEMITSDSLRVNGRILGKNDFISYKLNVNAVVAVKEGEFFQCNTSNRDYTRQFLVLYLKNGEHPDNGNSSTTTTTTTTTTATTTTTTTTSHQSRHRQFDDQLLRKWRSAFFKCIVSLGSEFHVNILYNLKFDKIITKNRQTFTQAHTKCLPVRDAQNDLRFVHDKFQQWANLSLKKTNVCSNYTSVNEIKTQFLAELKRNGITCKPKLIPASLLIEWLKEIHIINIVAFHHYKNSHNVRKNKRNVLLGVKCV